MSGRHILVIGGGFTGLSAAKELLDSGAEVTLVESSDELGGLAASFQVGGEHLEKAYHHIFKTDTDIIDLIEAVGGSDDLEWLDSSVAVYRDKKLWSFKNPLDLLRFKPCSLMGRLRMGAAVLYLKHLKRWEKLSDVTALAWMRKICGKSAVEVVWQPLLKGKFSRHFDSVSMAWLWARLHVRANSREAKGEGEKLGYIKGGFSRLVGKIEKFLEQKGVNFIKGTKVDSIESIERGKVCVGLDGVKHEFDQVLATVSNRIFSYFVREQSLEDYKSKLEAIEYLGAMCLVFTSDQKLGDYYWVNVNEDHAEFLVFIRHTKLVDSERYGGKEVYYVGKYCEQDMGEFLRPDDDVKENWYSYVGQMFPEFDAEQVSDEFLFRFRDAQHIVKCDYGSRIVDYSTPLDGVYLANFTQIYPEDRGTNYAVREGTKVAKLMVENWNLRH